MTGPRRRGALWGRLAGASVLALLGAVSWHTVVGGTALEVGAGHLSLRLPPVPVPEENPLTPAKVVLGSRLFFDPGLSADGSVACSSCHRPELYFADDRPYSVGVGHLAGERNTPTILNASYSPSLMWDGRSAGLEDQVRYPVTHPREMDMTPEKVEDYLAASPEYTALFKQAFGEDWVAWEQICQAIAAFERTLLTGNAPFDRYFAGDASAVPAAARRGWELFRGKAGCIGCHAYDAERPFLTDFGFHNAGVGWSAEKPDLGRYQISKAREDKGAFRTPSLRNVARTAPYMHDGSLSDLAAVVEHYVAGGEPNPLLDPMLRPLDLSAAERLDLVAFLESLTGEMTYVAMPPPQAATKERPAGAGARVPFYTAGGRVELVAGSGRAPAALAGPADVGDGGPATEALLAQPGGLAADRRGNVYIADTLHHRVRWVDGADGRIRTLVGTGLPGFNGDGLAGSDTQLSSPGQIQLDEQGRLYIADQGNQRVRVYDPATQRVSTLAGNGVAGESGDGGPAGEASLASPQGLYLDGPDTLVVASAVSSSLRRVDLRSGRIWRVPLRDPSVPTDRVIQGVSRWNGALVLAMPGPSPGSVDLLARSGRLTHLLSAPDVESPSGAAVSPDDELFVSDPGRDRVLRWTGRAMEVVAQGLGQPRAISFDARGDLLVADTLHHRVLRIRLDGGPAVLAALEP